MCAVAAPSYKFDMGIDRRAMIAIAVGLLVIAGGIGAFTAARNASQPSPALGADRQTRPATWPLGDDARTGFADPVTGGFSVGSVAVKGLLPTAATDTLELEQDGARLLLRGSGNGGHVQWTAAAGNPHTIVAGSLTAPTSDGEAPPDPIISHVVLPDGEVVYSDSKLHRVPLASSLDLHSIGAGPIVWRNGDDAVTFWQWQADRVRIAVAKDGGFVVSFVWYDPALHHTSCTDGERKIDFGVSVSFADVPAMTVSRFPDGIASAVVPIFTDPRELSEASLRDGVAANPDDFASRLRTVAAGHSSPEDARHGNGGLAGLDVGGTLVVPDEWAEADSVSDLETLLSESRIELVSASQLNPDACADLALVAPHDFDGRFPNILGPAGKASLPGWVGADVHWQPTRLTGRRRDVVTQALSSIYLNKLADARGLAVLEIPLVATRNPLVAAAAESLLEPERGGHWTIHTELARALAEVELGKESGRFDFMGLGELTDHLSTVARLQFDQREDGRWRIHNPTDADAVGVTLIVEGEPTLEIGADADRVRRPVGNGTEQTWISFDVGATQSIDLSMGPSRPSSVNWQPAK